MQQSSDKKDKIKSQQEAQKYILSFVKFLEDQQKFLQKDINILISHKSLGLGHSQCPAKSLKYRRAKFPKQQQAGSWHDIRTKMQKRVQKLKDPQINNLLITSDLLTWSIPNLCSSYMGIMNYIKKWKTQVLSTLSSQQKSDRNQLCKKLISQKQQNYSKILLQKDEICQLNILKVPLIIISDYFQKWSQIARYYQQKQLYFKNKLLKLVQSSTQHNNSQQLDELNNRLNLAKLQRIQIENRVKQAQKYIQDIETVQSLDPQVYKNRLILNQYKPLINPRNKYLYRYGKRLTFLMILKKRVKTAQKHLKQRKDAIYQLVDKQKSYIETLAQYIEYIKLPIQKAKLLPQEQQRLLFCNIEQIKKFHEQLYQILLQRFQQHHKYQTYGDIIKSRIPFFKLYLDYIYQAKNAQSLMVKLIKQNPKIKQICDKYFIQKHKAAKDQLSQPTFKIARYQMMFDQIIKKTNPSTVDYKLFVESKLLFNHCLRQVNDTVDKIVRRNKLNQLEQQFGTQEQPIFVNQNSEYLNEYTALLIYQQKFLNVILFAFTDVILIAQQSTRKKLKYIQVDQKFYVRRDQDSKVYKNVIKIHSKQGYVTVSTGNDQKDFKKAHQMFQVLKKIQKTTQCRELIYVEVLGTEEIGSTSFAKYTEYIIQIKFISLKKLIHLRFSQIANIVKVMQKFYSDSLGITQQETLKKTWFSNHKSKTIQDRKRTIQQILQKLFNHQKIKLQPMFLLNYLNLPQNFFDIAKKLSSQKNKIPTTESSLMFRKKQSISIESGSNSNGSSQFVVEDSNSPNSKLIDKQSLKGLKISDLVLNSLLKTESQLSKKELKQAFTLLCATQIKLGRDIYHDLDQKVQARKQQAQKIQIYIHTMPTNQVKMVRVTQFDTVEDVCNKVSKLLGLRSNRDFRLFHQIGKKELRVLEHEQFILKIFSFPKPKRTSSTGNVSSLVNNVTNVVQSMASSLIKVISPQTHPTLIFKKYYFLPFQIQSRECRKDLTRLRLLTYQVFAQVKDMKYQLNFQQYLDLTALLIYIELDGDVNMQKVDPKIIHRIIPQTIFKLKNYSQQEWLKKVQPKLLKYQQQLRKVIQYNEQQMKQNKIKIDITQKMALYFGHRHLASQIVLNKIKSNPIYGSNLFYVQPYKKTYQQLKQQSLKMAYNMWLAVKVDSISLLTPSSKQSQFELKYTAIQKINVYSQAIVFKTDDFTNRQYRFNTYQSFEISQLVRYYKTLNEILRELGEDEKLSNQVKKYRNQIQKYRSTYQNPDQNYDHLEINFAAY